VPCLLPNLRSRAEFFQASQSSFLRPWIFPFSHISILCSFLKPPLSSLGQLIHGSPIVCFHSQTFKKSPCKRKTAPPSPMRLSSHLSSCVLTSLNCCSSSFLQRCWIQILIFPNISFLPIVVLFSVSKGINSLHCFSF